MHETSPGSGSTEPTEPAGPAEEATPDFDDASVDPDMPEIMRESELARLRWARWRHHRGD